VFGRLAAGAAGEGAVRCEAGGETGQESRSVARWTAANLVAMEITIRTQERCNG
jgi:anti-sigma factor RsiW